MKNYLMSLLIIIFIAGCNREGANNIGIVSEETKPLQLWSAHKSLSIPVDVCAQKGNSALISLGFTGVVRNGNYSYGNFINNRASVKCVKMNDNSFVYLAVAGQDKKLVEKLRNEIAWKF